MRQARAFAVPEVLQTSAMDCGPAVLKAVLDGYGLSCDYGQLRERCETDVEGTSIDVLARIAREHGCESQQLLVSRDTLLLPEARCLPAIVVTEAADGVLHFVVVWRVLGRWVQIMDPSRGRRWRRKEELLSELHERRLPVSSDKWQRFMLSARGRACLHARTRRLGCSPGQTSALLALPQSKSWRGLARLDAALRMLDELVDTGSLARGKAAHALLFAIARRPLRAEERELIPARFWWVEGETPSGGLWLRCCVLVHVPAPARVALSPLPEQGSQRPARTQAEEAPAPRELALSLPELVKHALMAPRLSPLRVVWQLLRAQPGGALVASCAALVLRALTVPCEAVLLRALLEMEAYLTLDYQQAGALAAVLLLVLIGLFLELGFTRKLRELGRALELQLRVALLQKLPRLPDSYLRTRPASDLPGRAHALHRIRELPALLGHGALSLLSLVANLLGLLWLYPGGALLALGGALVALLLPWFADSKLLGTSTRLRAQGAALDGLFLDVLRGATPIRVHGAEQAVMRAHERLLTQWTCSAQLAQRQGIALQSRQLLASSVMAALLVVSYVRDGGAPSGLLLLAFWALRMPASAQQLSAVQLALRQVRASLTRMLAPLAAPETELGAAVGGDASAVCIELRGVCVRVDGRELLRELALTIAPGEHVAIVGASGAGKSTLLSLLLGFIEVGEGALLVNGRALDPARAAALRTRTAWLDPSVQLWNRPLLDNLTYAGKAQADLSGALSSADLLSVLETLPAGMQESLGEGGLRVSGGQGQRVRFGRSFLQEGVRLALLDEPFRGLEREQRSALLARARERFRAATLLCVSHDVSDTVSFDRVLVLEHGRLAEDGAPSALLRDPASRYARMVRAEEALRGEVWRDGAWQRHVLCHGRLERESA